MEPHKKLCGIEGYEPSLNGSPEQYFDQALSFTLRFYETEFQQILGTKFSFLTPHRFFNEFVWVVHASGFSAKAVGGLISKLTMAYDDYESLAEESFESMFERVRLVFNNRQKAMSTHRGAKLLTNGIREHGWELYRDKSLSSPKLLQRYPHIGKTTCFHLARNVGLLDFVKPDLHLVRMTSHWGFSDCETMCDHMRKHSVKGKNLPLGMVDLALWYAASTFGTVSIK